MLSQPGGWSGRGMAEKMRKFIGLGAGPVLGIAGAVTAGAVALGIYLDAQRDSGQAPEPPAGTRIEAMTSKDKRDGSFITTKFSTLFSSKLLQTVSVFFKVCSQD